MADKCFLGDVHVNSLFFNLNAHLKMTMVTFDSATGKGIYQSDWTGDFAKNYPNLTFDYPCGSGTLTTVGDQGTIKSTWSASDHQFLVEAEFMGYPASFTCHE